jgi:hypothetical protein
LTHHFGLRQAEHKLQERRRVGGEPVLELAARLGDLLINEGLEFRATDVREDSTDNS